jgi:5'-3' exonuclease
MKELALVDGDIVAFRCAATCEGEPQEIAEVRTEEMMRRIMHETNALNYKCFLTGKDNFRKKIYPEYKANRKDKPKPKWLGACREYLSKQWNAQTIHGREADDELGIEQTVHELNSVICTIDKDLLQIPGYHYNFVTGESRFVSPYDGLRFFYCQIIEGDQSDNIPAFDGKFRNKRPQFIQKIVDPVYEMTDAHEMYKYVCQVWGDDKESVHRYAQCLWILRKENAYWEPPVEVDEHDPVETSTSQD